MVDGTSDAELVRLGLRLTELEAHEESVCFGGRVFITLQRAGKADLGDGFDPGAVIAFTPKRSETAVSWKAIVARRRTGSIAVAFDEPPSEEIWNGRLTLTILPNDVTYRRARAALAETRVMDKGAARHRREVLLGLAEPRATTPDDRPLKQTLNPEQARAVHACLAADDVFLVHGPPGTGKSSVLAEVAPQAVRRGQRVLATAASNAAVDRLVAICAAQGLDVVRIGHPARVAGRVVRRVDAVSGNSSKLSRNYRRRVAELQARRRTGKGQVVDVFQTQTNNRWPLGAFTVVELRSAR